MKFFLFSLIVSTSFTLFGSSTEERLMNLPPHEYLELARDRNITNSWVKMEGRLYYKGPERKLKKKIYMSARFKPESWLMKLQIEGSEAWTVRQVPSEGIDGISVLKSEGAPNSEPVLGDFQLRPEDLTLSFIYWNFVSEEESETVKLQRCRVMNLEHPSKKEKVRVWFMLEYAFPIRVQWIKDGETQRQLDFVGSHKIQSSSNPDKYFRMVEEVRMSNRGWKTQVLFKKFEGDEVTASAQAPADLFNTIK